MALQDQSSIIPVSYVKKQRSKYHILYKLYTRRHIYKVPCSKGPYTTSFLRSKNPIPLKLYVQRTTQDCKAIVVYVLLIFPI